MSDSHETVPDESSSTSTTSSAISSASPVLPPGKHHTSGSEEHEHHGFSLGLAAGIVGGILLLSIIGFFVFQCIRQRRRKHRKHQSKESFWHKWHLKTYSRVDAQGSSAKELSDTTGRARGYNEHHDDDDDIDDDVEAGGTERRESVMDWLNGREFRRASTVAGSEGFEEELKEERAKKKKQRPATVHKVKRYKPNDSFEIDSDVRLSVDLTLVPSGSSR